MTSATGSFPSVDGVTSLTNSNGISDAYSLQLNTKPFSTPLCAGHPMCLGEQQFVYSNETSSAFIQYWLVRYNDNDCPDGWNSYEDTDTSDIYCWRNGTDSVDVPSQTITNLGNLSLTGTANADGDDSIIMGTGADDYYAANMGNILDLGDAWTGVEFIIAGDCCLRQAIFNDGSTITVRTVVHNGTTNAPTCVSEGYTSESNNLTLVGTPAIAVGPAPRIESVQSNIPGTPGSCKAAASTGDPHLTTFNGLQYDFQASGDFVLAQAQDFTVQTRQISGAPTWPNASINQAIATQMGATRVSMCTAPNRLVVDGRPLSLQDGDPLVLPSGVTIKRTANRYRVTDSRGNSVQAVMHDETYIDVAVGLGRWPAQVRGLLANPNGNPALLQTRSGSVLEVPLPFQTLYYQYGDSWRVPAANSLLLDCGPARQTGNPTAPFTVANLNTQLREWAMGVCRSLGVRDAVLNACTLDVAVLGVKAAQVYVGMPDPVLAF
jgi:hypothetical protein